MDLLDAYENAQRQHSSGKVAGGDPAWKKQRLELEEQQQQQQEEKKDFLSLLRVQQLLQAGDTDGCHVDNVGPLRIVRIGSTKKTPLEIAVSDASVAVSVTCLVFDPIIASAVASASLGSLFVADRVRATRGKGYLTLNVATSSSLRFLTAQEAAKVPPAPIHADNSVFALSTDSQKRSSQQQQQIATDVWVCLRCRVVNEHALNKCTSCLGVSVFKSCVCGKKFLSDAAQHCGYCGKRLLLFDEAVETQMGDHVLARPTQDAEQHGLLSAATVPAEADAPIDVMAHQQHRQLEDNAKVGRDDDDVLGDGEKRKRMLPNFMKSAEENAQNLARIQETLLILQHNALSDGLEFVNGSFPLVADVSELRGKRVVCFDTETTGFTRDDCVIEVGAVELLPDANSGSFYRSGILFQSYMKPRAGCQVHPYAMEVHGLSDDFLSVQPDAHDVMERFLKFIDGAVLVGHNVEFDLSALSYHLMRLKLHAPALCQAFCTLQRFRSRIKLPSYTLANCARYFRIAVSNGALHGALNDSELTAKLFLELWNAK